MKNEDLDGVFCEVQTCLQDKVEQYRSCIYTHKRILKRMHCSMGNQCNSASNGDP